MSNPFPQLQIPTPSLGATGVVPDAGAQFSQNLAQGLQSGTALAEAHAQSQAKKAAAAKLAQEAKDQADGAAAYYQQVSGAAQRSTAPKDGAPPSPSADEAQPLTPLPALERTLSPGGMNAYHKLLADYNQTLIQQQTVAQSHADITRIHQETDAAIRSQDEDRQLHAILDPLAGRPWTPKTMAQAVNGAMRISVPKAQQLATLLNGMMPQYAPHINADGTLSYVPSKPGPVVGAPLQPERPTDEQGKLAQYSYRVLEANATMTRLEGQYPGIGQAVDEKLSNVRALEQVPSFGRAAATKALRVMVRGMSPEERIYWNSRVDLGNAVLRRASGAQINMEELDRETSPYVPISGEDEGVVTSKQQRRLQTGLNFSQQAASAFNPNALTAEARRSMLGAFIEHPGYSADNPFHPQPGTTIQRRKP